MWKTGVCSVSFRGNTPQQIIDAAAAAGLDGIEWGSDVHVPAGDTANAAAVRRATEAAGLQVLSYGGYYRLGMSAPEELDGLLACAQALGVRNVRIWGGLKKPEELTPEDWAALVKEGREAAAKAAEKGLVLSLECHHGTVTEDWHSAAKFLQLVHHPALRMYWQPNQFRDDAYNGQAAAALGAQVTNVHVFSWLPDERLPLAAHTALWKRYLAQLKRTLPGGEEHAFLLEFMPDDRLETLAGESAVLRRWIAEENGKTEKD